MSERLTMINYVRETPEAILKNVENSKALTQPLVDEYLSKDYNRIIIVASGSSYNGSVCGKPFLQKILKKDVKVIPPFTFVNFKNDVREDDLVIVASQSGRSTNSIEAIETMKEKGHRVVGLTGDVDSDFKELCDVTVDWGVGVEKVGFVTKGVVTIALFLMLFGVEAQLAKGEITAEEAECYKNEFRKAADAHVELQASAAKYVENHQKDLLSLSNIFLISSGANQGTIMEGALKIGETVHIHATAYESEEFLHGPVFSINPEYMVIAMETGNKKVNERIEEIYEGTAIVTDRLCLVKCGESADVNTISTKVELMDEVMPLAYLAVCPILANFASNELRSERHVLCNKFREKVGIKSNKVPRKVEMERFN